MEIYENRRYPRTLYEVETNVEVVRCDCGGIEITTRNKYAGVVSVCTCLLNKGQSTELTKALVDSSEGGILDMEVNRAEKYKHDNTKCPHYFANECRLPTALWCDRQNRFGCCNATYPID